MVFNFEAKSFFESIQVLTEELRTCSKIEPPLKNKSLFSMLTANTNILEVFNYFIF